MDSKEDERKKQFDQKKKPHETSRNEWWKTYTYEIQKNEKQLKNVKRQRHEWKKNTLWTKSQQEQKEWERERKKKRIASEKETV